MQTLLTTVAALHIARLRSSRLHQLSSRFFSRLATERSYSKSLYEGEVSSV